MPKRKSYIDEHGDAVELDDKFFAQAVRGRPPLPESERKTRVTMMLDPDVVSRLKANGKGWQTRANTLLRDALGL
ncbi:BrnA antitoxin family protein [Tritonibacter scottomollicae]|uniref:BrnA antitoxin family protein n=1 Tax=Tritonibacter scottomollicae TaxID=483013 RepID=UPI003AA8238E